MTELRDLTDDELAEELRQAQLAHDTAVAASADSDSAQARISAVEREMHLRNGVGVLVRKYQQRNPFQK